MPIHNIVLSRHFTHSKEERQRETGQIATLIKSLATKASKNVPLTSINLGHNQTQCRQAVTAWGKREGGGWWKEREEWEMKRKRRGEEERQEGFLTTVSHLTG